MMCFDVFFEECFGFLSELFGGLVFVLIYL